MTKLKVVAIVLAVITMFASCSSGNIILKNNKETGDQGTAQNNQSSGG